MTVYTSDRTILSCTVQIRVLAGVGTLGLDIVPHARAFAIAA